MVAYHLSDTHEVDKRDGSRTERNQKRRPNKNAVVNGIGTKRTISSSPQKLNGRAYRNFASSNREDTITRVSFQHPVEVAKEYKGGEHRQRMLCFRAMPLPAFHRSIVLPVVLTNNEKPLTQSHEKKIRERDFSSQNSFLKCKDFLTCSYLVANHAVEKRWFKQQSSTWESTRSSALLPFKKNAESKKACGVNRSHSPSPLFFQRDKPHGSFVTVRREPSKTMSPEKNAAREPSTTCRKHLTIVYLKQKLVPGKARTQNKLVDIQSVQKSFCLLEGWHW